MQLSGKTRFIIGASIAVVGAPIAIALGEAATERRIAQASKPTPAPEVVRPAGPSPAQIRLNNSNERRGSVRRQCHAAFKASMYDPSSFRVVGERFNELPNDDGTGHIAYIADVSGTNGFGGRIVKNIACIADGSVITDYQF